MALPSVALAQPSLESQRPVAERLIAAALRDSAAYNRIAHLVDRFGARPSGSQNLEKAIDWIVTEMNKDGFDRVYTEPVMVKH